MLRGSRPRTAGETGSGTALEDACPQSAPAAAMRRTPVRDG
ncbi:hypothetical protein SLNWT_2039 [Streptomyces albus]|uniref:Uncharacterized protein n=1 Tax=Streptomyces albus (strain ATCC 21838 / DSM 41398 / FERM P-419 / JCM 4703 / NBRC 107858) TaxID=1081613 RepID=A0A0B5ET34_STRA4|nr:hypothetical protein SLNWT_2039 [Streptomyces albus]AOU76729.1 hypothetical protein SLNHY_2038 [Streptomyces albus]AYN32509.1 hypothetical protein DUI70_2006 [Streptomyces albus]